MAGEPIQLRCNGCGNDLPPGLQCVVAPCCHIFCTDCAQKLIENDDVCPLCQAVFSKSNVKVVNVLQSSSRYKLMLCGQTPEVIVDSALMAINFYVEQQRLSGLYSNHQLTQKMASIQQQCKKKLVEMQTAFQQAKQKCVQAMQQRNALEQDNQELQQKYAQKASQTRKLQDMFKALQQENEELKRHLGMRGNAVGGTCGGRSGLAAPRSGANTTRQVSPFRTGTTQMVTTVQHTKAMFDMSSGSGSGLHMLTGHGSSVIGSGNTTGNPSLGGQFGNMFSGGSHGMGGAGQRPSTAGGMFGLAAAGLANGRGGGGGANALRLQGGMAFGSPAGGMMSL